MLLKPPYLLAPSMIAEMRENDRIQLIPVSTLRKYTECDRTKVAKCSGKKPMDVVKALWACLEKEGVNEVVILVYSTKDDLIYATEGNTKIAAAKYGGIIKYLQA